DVSSLKRSLEQLSTQNEQLTKTLASKNKFLEEQRYLQQTGREMMEAQQDLEVCLHEELSALQVREEQLEHLARELCHLRQRLQEQRETESAEVARLQIRLQMLAPGQRQVHEAEDPSAIEAEVVEVAEASRKAVGRAEMWMSCLPEQVREDAGLGTSFDAICGLYRCYHKARMLSSNIHEHFVASAALPRDLPTMRWLCSANLVSAELAYAALGVLGCLQATEVSQYSSLMEQANFTACAHGEHGLDALLRAFLQVCRGEAGTAADKREALLAAVRASGAQLMSLQKALFKEQHACSALRSTCAAEALRAACAGALYASSLAGGDARQSWKDCGDVGWSKASVL
ncbi:unnamed protein product, partial [Durusdinium trenchii]